jgi:RNA polymerase sigma-70 factor, ECF subfamily
MEESDEELVRRTREGDAAAFDALVRRHLRAAYAVALARVGRPADADDVVQEAFVSALEQLERCRHPDRFRAWLLQIVRNRALNVRRSERLREGFPLEDAAGMSGGEDPSHDAAREELRRRLLEALGGLTATEREVVLLFDFEGLRHREIAAQLGITEGSARVHLSNGRRKLRERLGTAYQEDA